ASTLAAGESQLVELAKVLNLRARIVILDEPSAVLAPAETERLWTQIRALAGEGRGVVLITHKLADVNACADRVAVMRQGKVVLDAAQSTLGEPALLAAVMGDRRAVAIPATAVPVDALPRVQLRAVCARNGGGAIDAIDLSIARGEVLGIAGVSGNGQDLLADACAGMAPLAAGEIIIDGAPWFAPRMTPDPARRVGYIPEQPLHNAMVADLPAWLNLALRRLSALPFVPRRAQLLQDAQARMTGYDVRPLDARLPAGRFSGGNLQKLVAAREFDPPPPFVVASYPTMGLDFGAAALIYRRLFDLAQAGSAVLWISEDLDDLLQHAHRIAVMARGRIVAVTTADRTSKAELGRWMLGSTAPQPVAA
ncbi:MAG: ATP-binding cassette domain-containing protein, partial [Burkholderiales bacterium]|nr:ATP-binding cassette domain-containing protein [Burkholderiales bacterium]